MRAPPLADSVGTDRYRSQAAANPVAKRSEVEMSLNRFAFSAVGGAYMIAVHAPALQLELTYVAFYLLFSTALLLHIRRTPHPVMSRAAIALFADFGMLSLQMHAGGATTSVLYPVYLWVILGNGFRFGLRFLFAAMVVALAGFGIVCRTTPFWLHEHYLWLGLMVGLIIVPGYGATLIAKLSAARREAEAADQAKSMFLASVSHSVRTPLNAILGSLGLLEDSPLDNEQRELAQQLRTGSDILMSLVSSILDFSQLEADRMPVRLSAVDIGSIVLKLRHLLAPQARTRGIELFVHIAPDVPQLIQSDPRHLHEILVNLLSNALKFTESGGVGIAMTASPREGGRVLLRIEVSDTGIGIREDALDHIFESFTQADGTIIDRFGGTGLGLATVRRLVLLLGGTISVGSTLGQGSTFSLELDCSVAFGADDPGNGTILSRIVFFRDSPEDSVMDAYLRQLCTSLIVVTDRATLASHLNHVLHDVSGTLLVLDCASRESRASLSSLLADIDRNGDLPRLLVAREVDPDEVGLLSRWVTSMVGSDCDPDQLRAAVQRCVVQITTPGPASRVPIAPESSRLRILVADDNLTNQKLIEKILQRAGHSTHTVLNGEEAVIALTEHRFDLALLDLNMPVMGGLEAAKEYAFLSLGQKAVPLVALTADATQETAERCLEAGMVACITKPVIPADLVSRIQGFVANAGIAAPPPSVVYDIRSHPQFSTSRAPLDIQVMAELELLGGRDFAADLLEGFINEAHALGLQITQAAAADDMLSFRNGAHALRSAAANVGAVAVHDLCGQCRSLPAACLVRDGVPLADRIRTAIDRVEDEIPVRNRVRQ